MHEKLPIFHYLMGPNLTQAEGQVFGIGCKIFTIAGPVILYGMPAGSQGYCIMCWTGWERIGRKGVMRRR